MARAFINATIWTMAPKGSGVRPGVSPDGGAQPWLQRADALLWEDDTILAVGKEAEVLRQAREAGATIEDLGGRVVFPGFVDAHMHFIHAGIKHLRPDLRGSRSLEDCMARVESWLRDHPGTDAVTGEGWDESGWEERRRPTRQDLDRAAAAAGQPDRPLVLRRIDGHIAVANSAALPTIRRRWDSADVVDMGSGVLLEEASLYLNEAIPASAATLDAAVLEACRLAHAHGVTSLGDYSQAPFRAALQRAAARGTLTVRVASSIYVQQLDGERATGFRSGRRALGPKDEAALPQPGSHDGVVPGVAGGDPVSGGTSPFLRDAGLKVFLDGSLGAHTAALREEYLDAPGHNHGDPARPGAAGQATGQPGASGQPAKRGKLNWSDAELEGLFVQAHEAGVQVHAHAIGDAAIDQGLAAFAKVAARAGPAGWGRNALRHRFEHFEIVHDGQMKQAAALGIVSSSQPNFVGEWSSKGGMYEARLGRRFLLNNRFQDMNRAGIAIAFGSDGMPFGPLVGIQAATLHPDVPQRMAPLEAVWHYTWMAAWSLHWEQVVGSLEVGKKADFVVLEDTDLEAPPGAWRIRETIVAGEVMFQRSKPPAPSRS
ncbi:MAG: amidohydrolase [Thermoplasmatota archaeon]